MHVDRCTKALLLLIGLGLWAVAFVHFLSPTPAIAQDEPVPVNIERIGGRLIIGSAVPIRPQDGAMPITGDPVQLFPVQVTVAR